MMEAKKHERFGSAVERFKTLAGLANDEAERLVTAAVDASADQALEMIAGEGPVPSNLTALRAEQAKFACLRAKRILDQREAEVLFRATPASAKSILGTMRATYEESLRQHFLERMREDATVRPAGSENTGLRWKITFSESATYEVARNELHRRGLAELILEDSATRHVLEVDQKSSAAGITVLEALQLERPIGE